jgi:sigma-B regulation protein RsbU (phosphoserine phosphatase)
MAFWFWFFAGVGVGGFLGWLLYLSARRESVQLDEEMQHLQQEKQIVVEFMHNMVESTGQGLSKRELFQRIVHAAVLSTGALSACAYERTADEQLKGVAVEGLFPPQRLLPGEGGTEAPATRAKFLEQVLKAENYAMGEGLIGSVARSGKAVLITDAQKDPRVVVHADPSLVVRSLIVAPILFREEVLGVLAVANPTDEVAFNEADFSLVQSLAEQAALALHNVDLMRMEIEKSKLDFDLAVASSVQGLLLPRSFPQNAALEMDALYTTAQQVGGDLYDVFPLGGERVGVAVADVSGKGVSASLLMAICQTNLRHFARLHDSPAEVLRRINREMALEIPEKMFITIIYAIVDTAKHEITLARAGHELPLLLHQDEATGHLEVRTIGSEGMALGMVPPEIFDSVIGDQSVAFMRGDVLVLYTDGVTEALNAEGEEFSSGRLADSLKYLRQHSPKEMNQGILANVKTFAGASAQYDDITLVTVRHT